MVINETALGTDRPGGGPYLTDLTASVHWDRPDGFKVEGGVP